MKKIFVTGGHGFIASHVINQLKKKGYQVVTNVRSNRYLLDEDYQEILDGVEVYQFDVSDAKAVQKVIEQADGVIHLAAMLGTKHIKNAKNFYMNNLFPAIDIYESCIEYDVPVSYICVGNYFEHNNYSNSKVAAERELLKYSKFLGLKGIAVRALNAVGERQKYRNTGKIAPTFIHQALHGGPITVYGGKEYCSNMDIVYAGDVAGILIEALEKVNDGRIAPATILEAGTGIAPTVWEIAEMIVAKTDSTSEIKGLPMRHGETPKSTVAAENPYKYNYLSLDETLEKTITYYKNKWM